MITIEKTGSLTRRTAQVVANPKARPTAIPPTEAIRKVDPASTIENPPTVAAITANRYATNAVASFRRLSPSRIVTIRRGTPSRWNTALDATASGGETIAPSVSATAQAMSGTSSLATAPTRNVVNRTRPTASRRIARRFLRRSRIDVK